MKLVNDNGMIAVSNKVIAAVAGSAAAACFGVRGMTETSVWGEQMTKGVCVTPSEDGGSVDLELHIAVGPGVNIMAAGASIIAEVRYHVERQTGFRTGRITVCVDGVKA